MRHSVKHCFRSVAATTLAYSSSSLSSSLSSSSITNAMTMTMTMTPPIPTSAPVEAARALLLNAARSFYGRHSELIKESHGITHWERVHEHARHAIESLAKTTATAAATTTDDKMPRLSDEQVLEIEAAALLHDVDDDKYVPKAASTTATPTAADLDRKTTDERRDYYSSLYPNAAELLREAAVPESSHESILFIIDAVSCSKNGNSVPSRVDGGKNGHTKNTENANNYHLLIPRWSDRIEAVGARGVWRCYQYNQEKGRPLCLEGVTPRPNTEAELWSHVVPERFEAYMEAADGATEDPSMIGHYYDKLLHVACPPRDIVRNEYLEEKLRNSAKELIEVCLRYGRTGVVDEDYIRSFRDR